VKKLKHWAVFLILGLICNGVGILLHRQGEERIAIAIVILGIVNVATSLWLHHQSTKESN